MATHQIATFFLNEHFFGVPVEMVQEVIRSSQQTRVPLAHHAVGGLINLRGQILTTIDLRRRLDLNEVAGASKNLGSTLIRDRITELIDLECLVRRMDPEFFDARATSFS